MVNESSRFVFPEMGYVFMKTAEDCRLHSVSHTVDFFFLLRSIYYSVQLIIKLFIFLPLPYIVVFNCMKYLWSGQIYWQFLINC